MSADFGGIFHDVIMLHNVKSRDEAIDNTAQYLLDKGYVKESYTKATLEREKNYPTGLPVKPIGVAVPHSDAENVLKPAVILAILDNKVEFNLMGNSKDKIEVGLIFLLALKGEDNQINYLRNIMEFCKNQTSVLEMYNKSNKEDAREFFVKEILHDKGL